MDSDRACQQADSSQKGGYESATRRGSLCPAGSFLDPIRGGECYSCPTGYNRSAAHIDAANACYIPAKDDLRAATRVNNGLAWDCKSGTFWDGYDGGACWRCPSGYNRTGYPINTDKACSAAVAEVQHTATLVQKAQCGPGEFSDPNGGCYTCPTATDRTVFSVDSGQACQRAPGWRFARATKAMAMTCEADEIFDPVNSNNSAVAASLRNRNALLPDSPISAASSGGTCWTCPGGMKKRSMFPVYGSQACYPQDIVWQPAPYNQPGLFGLAGAEAVALKLVAERNTINQIIAGTIAGAPAGSLPVDYAKHVWNEIAARPQDNAELQTAVFSRVVAAANDPAHASADETMLLNDVVEQVRQFRIFMAQNALDAYHAWQDGQSFRDDRYLHSQLQQMTAIGKVPPDFDEITAETIIASLAANRASDSAISLLFSSKTVFKTLFPHADRPYYGTPEYDAYQNAAKVAQLAKDDAAYAKRLQSAITNGKKVTWAKNLEEFESAASAVRGAKAAIEGTEAGVEAAGGLTGAIASLGPQIIIGIGIEVLAAAIEQQIDIADAEPKLKANLATAKNYRADFARLMSTPDGTDQAIGYWSQLMGGPAMVAGKTRPPDKAPTDLQKFAGLAAAAAQ